MNKKSKLSPAAELLAKEAAAKREDPRPRKAVSVSFETYERLTNLAELIGVRRSELIRHMCTAYEG